MPAESVHLEWKSMVIDDLLRMFSPMTLLQVKYFHTFELKKDVYFFESRVCSPIKLVRIFLLL
ncbi:hypothetical protein X953_14955 [Virgibacillus sp. SK37]|nr:hypothetical protein X953_14955 [Virgibacillus sp. SK37]